METTYQVNGMTCGHCAHAIKQEVSNIDGVTAVQVDLPGTMTITSNDVIDFQLIAQAVDEAGDYEVVKP